MAKDLWDCSRSATSPDPETTVVDPPPLSEAWDQCVSSLQMPSVSIKRETGYGNQVPLPVPSSAASIKVDIEGKENRAWFGSSMGGDGGL